MYVQYYGVGTVPTDRIVQYIRVKKVLEREFSKLEEQKVSVLQPYFVFYFRESRVSESGGTKERNYHETP